MTKAMLLQSILDIEIPFGELRFRLEDIIDKYSIRGIENDIDEFEADIMKEILAKASFTDTEE